MPVGAATENFRRAGCRWLFKSSNVQRSSFKLQASSSDVFPSRLRPQASYFGVSRFIYKTITMISTANSGAFIREFFFQKPCHFSARHSPHLAGFLAQLKPQLP